MTFTRIAYFPFSSLSLPLVCQLLIILFRLEVFNRSKYWWARHIVTLAAENHVREKRVSGLCWWDSTLACSRGVECSQLLWGQDMVLLTQRRKIDQIPLSSTTSVCQGCSHSEESGDFMSPSSSCRYGGREDRKRALLWLFFKISFQMEMTWVEERITCYEDSHHMFFPSLSKKGCHEDRKMSQITLTSPEWS